MTETPRVAVYADAPFGVIVSSIVILSSQPARATKAKAVGIGFKEKLWSD